MEFLGSWFKQDEMQFALQEAIMLTSGTKWNVTYFSVPASIHLNTHLKYVTDIFLKGLKAVVKIPSIISRV